MFQIIKTTKPWIQLKTIQINWPLMKLTFLVYQLNQLVKEILFTFWFMIYLMEWRNIFLTFYLVSKLSLCLHDIYPILINYWSTLSADFHFGFNFFFSMFPGKQIDAIYHTSIVYFGNEYFFGQEGIAVMPYYVRIKLTIKRDD